jgi:hypothetical protein
MQSFTVLPNFSYTVKSISNIVTIWFLLDTVKMQNRISCYWFQIAYKTSTIKKYVDRILTAYHREICFCKLCRNNKVGLEFLSVSILFYHFQSGRGCIRSGKVSVCKNFDRETDFSLKTQD